MTFFPFLIIALSGLNDLCLSSRLDTIISNLRTEIRKTTKKEFGKKFVNLDINIINSYINVSFDECIMKCYTKPRCQAIEYRTRTKYCALVWKYDEVETQPGSNIAHGFVKKTSRRCGDKTCNRQETCVFGDKETNCKIEECANPRSGEPLSGNVFEIGGKIFIGCSTIENLPPAYFVCSSIGEWWTTAGPQPGITCNDLISAESYRLSDGLFIVTNQLGITLRCKMGVIDEWWIVFQFRRYGVVDFYRDWEDYKYGFGHICGDSWLGLEKIHSLINNSKKRYRLRLTLKDWNDVQQNHVYAPFSIKSEAHLYRLKMKWKTGDSVDALNISYGMSFSTYDRDNDDVAENCAAQLHGAWWYSSCEGANLNGRFYLRGELTNAEKGTGITWYTWHGYNYSLKKVVMRMKEL